MSAFKLKFAVLFFLMYLSLILKILNLTQKKEII